MIDAQRTEARRSLGRGRRSRSPGAARPFAYFVDRNTARANVAARSPGFYERPQRRSLENMIRSELKKALLSVRRTDQEIVGVVSDE